MKVYNLSEIQDTLNNIHPKQIVNKLGYEVKITLHEVKYEYTTNRNNKRTGVKYLLLDTFNPNPNYKKELEEFIEDYNKNNEHRPISNVKFLDGKCLGYINI